MPRVIRFDDFPMFCPNLTPRDIFKRGSFGGTYWRRIYSSVNKHVYSNQHLEFPPHWWLNIDDDMLISNIKNRHINKYKVKVGSTLKEWEDKGWIHPQDPYGWVQWYCRFYMGRRSDDDVRQIKRWNGVAGPNGRFRKRLFNIINKTNSNIDDYSISPRIRQTLQHWAYEIV